MHVDSRSRGAGDGDTIEAAMTSGIWFAIGVGLFALAALALVAGGRPRRPELGSVSDQWIAQHRAGQMDHTEYR